MDDDLAGRRQVRRDRERGVDIAFRQRLLRRGAIRIVRERDRGVFGVGRRGRLDGRLELRRRGADDADLHRLSAAAQEDRDAEARAEQHERHDEREQVATAPAALEDLRRATSQVDRMRDITPPPRRPAGERWSPP